MLDFDLILDLRLKPYIETLCQMESVSRMTGELRELAALACSCIFIHLHQPNAELYLL